MTTTPVRNAPKRTRPGGSVITIFVIIAGIAIGIAFLGWQIASNTVEAAAYHRALPCGSGSGATADCIFASANGFSLDFTTMRSARKPVAPNLMHRGLPLTENQPASKLGRLKRMRTS